MKIQEMTPAMFFAEITKPHEYMVAKLQRDLHKLRVNRFLLKFFKKHFRQNKTLGGKLALSSQLLFTLFS